MDPEVPKQGVSWSMASSSFPFSSHCIENPSQGVSEATREAEGVYIRSGIVVINKGTIIKDNTVI